jgi:hypothetical protein
MSESARNESGEVADPRVAIDRRIRTALDAAQQGSIPLSIANGLSMCAIGVTTLTRAAIETPSALANPGVQTFMEELYRDLKLILMKTDPENKAVREIVNQLIGPNHDEAAYQLQQLLPLV